MTAQSHIYFINVLRDGRWHSSGFSARSTSAAKVRAKYLLQHPSVRPANIKAVRHSSTKTRNPSSACLPTRRPSGKSRGFNVYEGKVITYRGTRYKIIGCGTGSVARKHAGAQVEGTYALLNEKTNKVRYVAKRTIRDLAYHRGVAGRPTAKGRLTAKRRKSTRAKTGRKANGQFARKGR